MLVFQLQEQHQKQALSSSIFFNGKMFLKQTVHLKRAGMPKPRNTEEDTEDKTEIVVKKMRTVITPTIMAQIKKIARPI